MGVGDTFHPTPVGVFFGGPGQAPGERVADPYFGGAGPDAQHLHRLRRVHDRLPAQRQEHPGQELPLPRRAERRDGAAADHGHPGRARATAAGTTYDVRFTKAKARRRSATRTLTAEQVVFAAAALGTQRLLHRMKDEGHLPRLSDRLGYLSRTNSESILGAIAPGHDGRLQPGRRDHVVVPPRRAHPHRAGALRQGQQRDVADADRAHRRRRRRAALADLAARRCGQERANVRDLYDVKHWSERTVIALVDADASTTRSRRSPSAARSPAGGT